MPWSRTALAGAVRTAFILGVLRPIVQHYGHLRVSGLDNLSKLKPPFLLAANHASHMDTAAILLALPPRLRQRTLVAAAADYFFDAPWKGALVALAVGAIAVERRRSPLGSVKLVRRLVDDGWSLVVYPEGGRSTDGRLHGGKRGIAHLAAACRVPVVPVGVVGTYKALPAGKFLPHKSQVEVRFGEPLFTDTLPLHPGPDGIRDATDGIMASIQALTGQELAPVTSGLQSVDGSPLITPEEHRLALR